MIYIALTTQPLQAQAMLATELKLTAYAPAQTLRRRLGRTERDIRRPLFGGYVFIDCGEADLARVHATRLVSGFVKRFLPSGDTTPATLAYSQLAPILEAAERGDYDRIPRKAKPTTKPRRVNALALIGELIASATTQEAEDMREAA